MAASRIVHQNAADANSPVLYGETTRIVGAREGSVQGYYPVAPDGHLVPYLYTWFGLRTLGAIGAVPA